MALLLGLGGVLAPASAASAPTRAQHNPASFQGLGDLPGGAEESYAISVSADGSTVCGWSGAAGGTTAFIWSNGRMSALDVGADGLVPRVAHAASADGRVVVGIGAAGAQSAAFRWEAGRTEPLLAPGSLGGTTDAWGISGDGRTIVGYTQEGGLAHALVWSGDAVSVLEGPPGERVSAFAMGLSADRSTPVGYSESERGTEAVAWREGRVVRLGRLPCGALHAEARAVSADGSVIVGTGSSKFGLEAVQWVEARAVPLGGYSRDHEFLASALGVTADGDLMVGYAITDRDLPVAVVWDEVHGIRELRALLVARFGLDLGGWRLEGATGVSADGATIVGRGRNPRGAFEGWIVRLSAHWWRDAEQPFRALPSGADGSVTPIRSPRLGLFDGAFEGLGSPGGVAIAPDGSVYIADTGNDLVRVFDSARGFQRAWGRAGTGLSFNRPEDVAVCDAGVVFVCDTGHHRIQVMDAKGRLRRYWGSRGAGPGQLDSPGGLGLDRDRVYVADTGNDRVQVFDHRGRWMRSFGSFGPGPGELNRPNDVAADEDGRVYVADTGNHRVARFTAAGEWLGAWGERGSMPGLFNRPTGVEYRGGLIYVADQANHRVQTVAKDGSLQAVWGPPAIRPHAAEGRVMLPARIALSPDLTRAVVCEPIEDRCQAFSMVVDSRDGLCGESLPPFAHLGPAIDVQGDILVVTDATADHVAVYGLAEPEPILITKVGVPGHGPGKLSDPRGVALNSDSSRLFIADSGNRRIQVYDLELPGDAGRRFVPNLARLVRTVDCRHWRPPAGRGLGGPVVRPMALARGDGLLAVADEGGGHVVLLNHELADPVWLGVDGTEDGKILRPVDLAFSVDGKRLFVLDAERASVVVFTSEGNYSASWGVGGAGAGERPGPSGIEAGRHGFVYVADESAHRILKFDERGRVQATWGEPGIDAGQFCKPRGLAQDASGRIYVVDFGNYRVQVLDDAGRFLRAFGLRLYVYPTLVTSGE